MSTFVHFFSEDVGGICLPRDVLDRNCLILNPLVNWVSVELNVTCCFWGHVVGPSNAGIIGIVDSCSFIDIWNRNTRLQNTPTKISEIGNLFRSRISGPNLPASQELREVCSWCSANQPRGPPFLKKIPLFILQNLNSGRRVPLAMAFPIWEPQKVSLYDKRVNKLVCFGGNASRYASTSLDSGKCMKECIILPMLSDVKEIP